LLVIVLFANAFFSAQPLAAEEFDWRNFYGQNWVSPVQDQEQWGTCWAYAACGTLESKYMLTRDDSSYRPNISEQQLVWETSPDLGDGEDGGKASNSLNYMTSHGVVLDSEIPTIRTDNRGGNDPWLTEGWQNRVFKSTSVNTQMAEDTGLDYIKSCLKQFGPLTLRCEVDNDWYPNPSGNRGNHAVVIVGFHDNVDGENAPGGGYWIIKNSWGDGWNGDGFGKIAYATRPTYEDDDIWHLWQDNVNVCGITGPAVFTGAMATVTWNGGSGTWASGASNFSGVDMYGTSLPTYAWENKETSVTFNASSGTNIAIDGTVITHGLTVSAGATGYVFNGTNKGILTVTGGGINANEDVVINAPVKIGAPQTWNVASGKWLTIGGDVHTIISGLTVNGPGNTIIDGSLDGGGAANAAGAAAGAITVNGGAYLYLRGNGGTNYYVNTNVANGGLVFQPPSYTSSNYHGVISGGGWIDKWGGGTAILSGANNYSNWTSIYDGAIQADSGAGLPSNSFLNLNGGVLQSNSDVTFTRTLGTSGANKFQWNTDGGGFAAGAGPMTVNIGNNGATVNWGNSIGDSIMGTLKFGSTTASNVTTFVNGINLNGNDRTIYVEDNPSSGSDIAVIAGNIVDTSGPYWAGLIKTGPGTLKLTGANAYGDNVKSGWTSIQGGALQANRGGGLPSTSVLDLSGGVLQSDSEITFSEVFWNDSPNANSISWNSGGFSAGGGKMTVNLYSDRRTISWGTDAHSSIGGAMVLSSTSAQFETEVQNGLNLNGASRVIRVDENPFSTGDYATISGAIVDSAGNGLGGIEKTGPGRLILTGANTYGDPTGYNGFTIITQGVLQADRGAGLPAMSGVILNGGVLQSSSETTFSDPLWYWAPDGREVIWRGGGFSAGGGKMTVNLFGDKRMLNWGTDGNVGIAGTMILSSSSAQFETEVQNAIDLGTDARTVQVDDNPNSAGDFANLSGAISGSGSLTKTGLGELRMTGVGNTYTGDTTVLDGRLILAKSSGYAIRGNLTITATTDRTFVILNGPNQIAPTSVVTFGGGTWPYLSLHGNNQTLAGISDTTGNGVIQNTFDETDVTQTSKLTVNNASNFSFNGYLRDTRTGTGVLSLAKSGVGTLTLSGGNITYSGGTTISGGRLVLQDTANANFLTCGIANYGTLELNAAISDINFSGAITGSGATVLNKSGQRQLTLSGASPNTATGTTTISGGTVVLAKTGGARAISGNILMSEPGDGSSTFLRLEGDNEIASTSYVTFTTPVGYSHLDINGHSQTLAGIESDPWAAIEGRWDNTGLDTDSALSISSSSSSTFRGILRNNATGTGTGRLKLLKSGIGTLTLTNNDNSFTGGTTVNGGTLQIGEGGDYGVLPGNEVVVNTGGTLYFNRSDAYSFSSPITGAGTVKIAQGDHGFAAGTGYNTSLTGFSGTTLIQSGVAYLYTVNGLGTGGISVANGATCSLWTGGTTSISLPFTLSGIGGTNDGYAKPAIYADGGSAAYTLTGQITLSATSDIGNYGGNGMMNLSGKITGIGGLVLGKASPTLADETGEITLSGTLGNNYTGGTTINRGTVYLQKTNNALAIPGNVTIKTATTAATGSTFLILKGSNQIASTAIMTFSPDNASYYSYFEMLGNDQTLGGINDTTGRGVIEHAESETNITANSILTINSTANSSFNGYLRNGNYGAGSTGTLALVKSGSYKLTLLGANSGGYTGGLTVTAGTLDYSGGTLPSGGSPYTITGGTLIVNNAITPIGNFQITGGTVSGSGMLTSNAAYDIQAGTVSAILGGSVGLNKTTSGIANINAPTYTGATTISDGTLNFTGGLPGGNYVVSGGTLNINSLIRSIGTFQITGGTVNGTGKLTSNSAYDIQAGTVNAILGGSVGLTKNTAGTATVNAPAYTGTTMVSGGTLNFTGSLPSGNYIVSNATVAIGALSGSIGSFTLNGGTINGSGTLSSNTTFNILSGTVNAVLSGSVGLNKTTSGIATLNAPTYTGTTSITSGTLNFTGGLPTGNYAISGGMLNTGALSQSIGSFQISGGTLCGTGTLISNACFDVRNGVVETALGGNLGLLKTGDGVVTLKGDNVYSGTTKIKGGTLALADGGQINPLSPIDNGATFVIVDGTHSLLEIVGTGSTLIGGSAQLSTTRIVQDSLTLGGNYSGLVALSARSTVQNAAVPEPSAMVLILTLGFGLAAAAFYRRR
jgi:autotransporter-associated beta strand protein